ncbi:hypothetical protein P7K49_015293, partial [Saguinus oedipus]
ILQWSRDYAVNAFIGKVCILKMEMTAVAESEVVDFGGKVVLDEDSQRLGTSASNKKKNEVVQTGPSPGAKEPSTLGTSVTPFFLWIRTESRIL